MCFLQHTDADFFVVQYERSGLFIHMHESKVLEVKAGVLPYVPLYTQIRKTGRCAHMQGMMKAPLYTLSVSESEQERLYDNKSV